MNSYRTLGPLDRDVGCGRWQTDRTQRVPFPVSLGVGVSSGGTEQAVSDDGAQKLRHLPKFRDAGEITTEGFCLPMWLRRRASGADRPTYYLASREVRDLALAPVTRGGEL